MASFHVEAVIIPAEKPGAAVFLIGEKRRGLRTGHLLT